MLIHLFQGGMLLALTVAIHTMVLSALLRWILTSYLDNAVLSFLTYLWILTRIAAATLMAHLFEIALWAGFYVWRNALPNMETAFYFSSVTYATIGYGDIVLPQSWRLLAAMEGLTGILMCGWTGAFFFAVVSKLYTSKRTN